MWLTPFVPCCFCVNGCTLPPPPPVKISVNARTITVEGKRGKLVRNFRHIQVGIKKLGARTVRIEMWYGHPPQPTQRSASWLAPKVTQP